MSLTCPRCRTALDVRAQEDVPRCDELGDRAAQGHELVHAEHVRLDAVRREHDPVDRRRDPPFRSVQCPDVVRSHPRAVAPYDDASASFSKETRC